MPTPPPRNAQEVAETIRPRLIIKVGTAIDADGREQPYASSVVPLKRDGVSSCEMARTLAVAMRAIINYAEGIQQEYGVPMVGLLQQYLDDSAGRTTGESYRPKPDIPLDDDGE